MRCWVVGLGGLVHACICSECKQKPNKLVTQTTNIAQKINVSAVKFKDQFGGDVQIWEIRSVTEEINHETKCVGTRIFNWCMCTSML